jgi:hypothetical protein
LHSWESGLYTAIDVLFGIFFNTLNFLFVFSGVIDFQRRKVMMKACGAMLDIVKSKF